MLWGKRIRKDFCSRCIATTTGRNTSNSSPWWGPQIGEMLKKLKIESNFIDGLRVTDAAILMLLKWFMYN